MVASAHETQPVRTGLSHNQPDPIQSGAVLHYSFSGVLPFPFPLSTDQPVDLHLHFIGLQFHFRLHLHLICILFSFLPQYLINCSNLLG